MTRHHLRVVEAGLWLVIARALVACLPLHVWRGSLGSITPCHAGNLADMPDALALACVHAVARAAHRMPASLCLPRAMALQWMLRRRCIPGQLVLGVKPCQRGGLDDLHAWVEMSGTVLMNDSGGAHREVLRLG